MQKYRKMQENTGKCRKMQENAGNTVTSIPFKGVIVVFWDYCCIPQRAVAPDGSAIKITAEEEAIFKMGFFRVVPKTEIL